MKDGGREIKWSLLQPNATKEKRICGFLCSVGHYEKLHAWRESHNLALAVYRVTNKFPNEERYGLTSQTRRAAFSAAVNIVEGSSRRGAREFRRFVDIALASLTEVGYAIRFAHEIGVLSEADWKALHEQYCRARFLTWRLYDSLRERRDG